jgi:uncharacterized protein (DUF433 family)
MARPSVDLYGGKDLISLPRYSIPQAAHHLRLPRGTVRSWVVGRNYPTMNGQRRSTRIVIPADPKGQVLSFSNLAELHVLCAIRRIHGVRLDNIRSAVAFLRKQFRSEQPLIEREFLTDGQDLFIEQFGRIVNVSQQGQIMFRWLNLYLSRLDRDAAGRPIRLYPFSGRIEEKSPKLIAIDPRIGFGQPCIAGTDIPTSILVERFEAGDSLEELALDYGRRALEIEEAIRYEQRSAA